MLWLAIGLQAGNSGIYLFVVNDLATDFERLAFELGFPVAYLVSLIVLNYLLTLPRFDYFNRILAINLIIYSFLGLTLSTLRLPLVSREAFLSGFLLSDVLLVIYYIIINRFFPKRLGVLTNVDITPFKAYPSLQATVVEPTALSNIRFNGIVANLRGEIDDYTSQYLSRLALQRIPVYDANTLVEMLWGRIPLGDLTPVEIEMFKPPIIYGSIKRVGEIVFIISIAPILIVTSLLIGIAIKLDSSGTILFTQTRTGLRGVPFKMLKFRSMFSTTENMYRFADKGDSRITRVGRALRRFRLDELPQIWNVLKGDMSLIGPRPEQVEFTDRFKQLIPFYGFRHTLRPGITGWSQVMYGYAASDEETRAKLEFDFFYIKHMSAWLDFVIVVKTIRTIIVGSGAR